MLGRGLAYGTVWRRRIPTAAILLVLSACGREAEPEADVQPEAAQELAATVEEGTPQEPERRPFLPDEMQRSTRAESFPHGAHGQIDCAVCHQVPQGHGSHAAVECADCHRTSANATLVALSPSECQSCHHAADQALACEACHESRPAVPSTQELFLEVWDAPRSRTFDFEHGRHTDLSCEQCHQALPALTPAEPCASCHTEHHTLEASCSACHLEPPEGAHDVEVHLTCSGSGCHRSPEVEAIATARPVCLTCHLEQMDHEPGGDCVECHQVRGEPTAWAVWRHL